MCQQTKELWERHRSEYELNISAYLRFVLHAVYSYVATYIMNSNVVSIFIIRYIIYLLVIVIGSGSLRAAVVTFSKCFM